MGIFNRLNSYARLVFGPDALHAESGEFSITETQNGRFAIKNVAKNTTLGTYSRRRDAVRGASRLGLVVA